MYPTSASPAFGEPWWAPSPLLTYSICITLSSSNFILSLVSRLFLHIQCRGGPQAQASQPPPQTPTVASETALSSQPSEPVESEAPPREPMESEDMEERTPAQTPELTPSGPAPAGPTPAPETNTPK